MLLSNLSTLLASDNATQLSTTTSAFLSANNASFPSAGIHQTDPVEARIQLTLAEMERRNGLFYTLGRYLGKWFGTSETNAKPKKKRHLMTASSPEKAPKQLVDPIDYVSEDNHKKAIHFVSTEDASGAFSLNAPGMQNSIDNIIHSGYNYYHRYISGATQICDILNKEFVDIQFDAIIISGHGFEFGAQLGKQAGAKDAMLTSRNVGAYLNCVPNHLRFDSKIIYQSCNTGSLHHLPLDWYYKIEGMHSFLEQFSKLYHFFKNGFSGEAVQHHHNLAFQTYSVLSHQLPHISVAGLRVSAGSEIHNLDTLYSGSFKDPYFQNANFFVVYNQESADLIYNGWKIEENLHGLFHYWPFSLLNGSSDQFAFELNQRKLLQALKYSPVRSFDDILTLYQDRLERDWLYLKDKLGNHAVYINQLYQAFVFACVGTSVWVGFQRRHALTNTATEFSRTLLKQFETKDPRGTVISALLVEEISNSTKDMSNYSRSGVR